MSKFVLIDHSLRDLGGHYYTYACCVLAAAERAGFEPVLATNAAFRDKEALPQSWTVCPVFSKKSYAGRSSQASASIRGVGVRTLLRRLRVALQRRIDLRIAKGFARNCATLFQRIELAPGDHVFVATATEIDLLGLAMYLRSRQSRARVAWHLQFHLSLFDGRYPDYHAQSGSKQPLRAIFREALDQIKNLDVRLYCTTEQLTEQYNLLGVATFSTLAYPVHELFHVRSPIVANVHPVKVACLGHNRKEKGYRQLPLIVQSIWDDYLRIGRAQIVLQTARRELRRELSEVVLQLGGAAGVHPIAYAPFPVALERYAQLVRESGIGLLLYDGAQYYARCSGVLIEMLTAGVPVIVPAGGWLAEQIDEENQRYLERLLTDVEQRRVLGRVEPTWHFSEENDFSVDAADRTHWRVIPANGRAEAELLCSGECTSLMIRFALAAPIMQGIYVRVAVREVDSRGEILTDREVILAPRIMGDMVHALFSLNGSASRLLITISNAWHRSELNIRDFECVQLSGEHMPCGSAGLTAATVAQSGQLLREILRYYEHYRERAIRFSTECIRLHDPGKIIARLTDGIEEQRLARRRARDVSDALKRELAQPVESPH